MNTFLSRDSDSLVISVGEGDMSEAGATLGFFDTDTFGGDTLPVIRHEATAGTMVNNSPGNWTYTTPLPDESQTRDANWRFARLDSFGADTLNIAAQDTNWKQYVPGGHVDLMDTVDWNALDAAINP